MLLYCRANPFKLHEDGIVTSKPIGHLGYMLIHRTPTHHHAIRHEFNESTKLLQRRVTSQETKRRRGREERKEEKRRRRYSLAKRFLSLLSFITPFITQSLKSFVTNSPFRHGNKHHMCQDNCYFYNNFSNSLALLNYTVILFITNSY